MESNPAAGTAAATPSVSAAFARNSPWSLVTFALAATMALLGGVTGAIYFAQARISGTLERERDVQRLTARIAYLDEVLTMSALMFAATGDAEWRARYDSHVDPLDNAIAGLRNISPEIFDRSLGVATNDANLALLAMETRALTLAADGERDVALQVLTSDEYSLQKRIYADGNREATEALAAMIQREADRQQTLYFGLLMVCYGLGAAVVGAWIWVIRALRQFDALRKLNAEFVAKTRELEAANRAKSLFLTHMSHEIRTPMTAILGYCDMLDELADAPGAASLRREAIQTIRRSGEHLLGVISGMLDVSRIEADKLVLDRADVDLAQLVNDLIALLAPKAVQKGIKLDAQCDTPIPRTIRTDALRVRQICLNLLGNALKFTARGGVSLRLGLVRSDPPALSIAIRDTGIGMTSAQMAGLFQPFAQVDDSMSRRFEGAGLGLYISRRLAELLGGDITVQSTPGEGSTFSLRLPLESIAGVELVTPAMKSSTELLPALSANAAVAVSPGSRLAGVRVLLAEDGPDNQRLISYHLRKEGAIVDVVSNGREALERLTVEGELLSDLPCDLLITDMQMPEMDGYALAASLRERGCGLPIVALTAHAMAHEAERCLKAGCNVYAAKPIQRDALIDVCSRAMQFAPASK
ncbi:MAG: ATP-binding protein [Phycisphaerae bacterium]|nr:ATP-binding protein [Phycisphaerae bacterium]